jgi:hypothetical protein
MLPRPIWIAVRPIFSRRAWRPLAAVLFAAALCCGPGEAPKPAPLSPEERYLVDAYVRVRRAEALHPWQRELADSLLAHLSGDVDTVRISRVISGLNATPERWPVIFEAIEKELGAPSGAQPSESTRS